MAAPAALIPELEDVLQQGAPERRAQMLKRITTLFLDGASRFNEDHVRLFDNILSRLTAEIEATARAELSDRLAPVNNAPMQVVRALAKDDDIAVAGPVLAQSRRLADSDLVDIAGTKSQAHLLAICNRSGIAEPVTEILVRRGDSDVIRGVAGNRGARLSDLSFSILVTRAEQDGDLAEKLRLRSDLPPELQADIQRVLAKVSNDGGGRAGPRDYAAAQRTVLALRQQGKLSEAQLVDFAKTGQYEETVASLALLCSVPIEVVDRLMSGDRSDPMLILGKSAGWGWATVRAIIMARSGGKSASSGGLDDAFANFERLSPATAQRVMRFWQARPASAGVTP
jgi:uncharacterized protein (DUF2336 family)